MVTNKGVSQVGGTKYTSPHGLPEDLLDRVLIVSTKDYSVDELEQNHSPAVRHPTLFPFRA